MIREHKKPPMWAFVLLASIVACGGSGRSRQANADADAIVGQEAMVRFGSDSTLYGIAVTVVAPDGTEMPALFFGPPRLAATVSGGTYRFHQDSIPPRVHLLDDDQRMERWVR